MIAELEQCSCGMLFTIPMLHDSMFRPHQQNGMHDRAKQIQLCGPCFMTVCHGCEGSRGTSGAWRCLCTHRGFEMIRPTDDYINELRIDWSNWLQAGCPAERNGRKKSH